MKNRLAIFRTFLTTAPLFQLFRYNVPMHSRLAHRARSLICGISLMFCGWSDFAFPASVQPSPPPGGYTNTVNFDFSRNIFDFFYQGADGTLKYEYAPGANLGGTFNPLTCTVNGTNRFQPSNVGGLSIWTGANEAVPWMPGVAFTLLNAQTNGSNTLQTLWKMTYGANALTYTFGFQISARTLIIQTAVQNGVAAAVYLDRCEGVANPVIIHVPYLTTMNVLYGTGVFASIYFDWETTSAATIYALDWVFSPTSVYYGEAAIYAPRTDGTRNRVNETIYLTVSPSFADVLPNVTNPISPYKSLSANYLVFDNWQAPFSTVNTQVETLYSAGISNLWVLVHDWQNGGYDNKYPNVVPANPSLGGDAALTNLSRTIRTSGYLFGLHENYVDFYTNAAAWSPAAIALNSDGSRKQAWFNPDTGMQSYQMKPTLAADYLTNFAPQIHSNYATTASFLDVHSAINPSDKVDYDAATTNAAMFRETLTRYRALAGLLRDIHQGPVSGEGHHHFFNVGYFDDIEAQLNSGGYDPSAQASRLPLLVDFDLLKLHDKAAVHGVGYYERFYSDTNDTQVVQAFPQSAVLEYMATELAYGHAGFIPTPDRLYDYVAAAKLEQRHIFPAQALYANATPVSILYHDSSNNDEVTVSDYIRRYPTTFGSQTNDHYLSQVRVTYNNGVVLCINRHPTRSWQVQLGQPGGCFNFNAVLNGTNVQWVGQTNLTSYLLPHVNGWVVFAPAPPKISSITQSNITVSLKLTNLLPGFSHYIERAFNLPPTNWDIVDTFVSSDVQTNWVQPITNSLPQAFYRVVRFW
jgi:hypothetical protein